MEYFLLNTAVMSNDAVVFIDGGFRSESGEPFSPSEYTLGLPPPSDLPDNLFVHADAQMPGKQIGGILGNTRSMLIVHADLKAVIESYKTKDEIIDFRQVSVVNAKKKVLSKDFFVISPRGTIDCLDKEKSDIKLLDGNPDKVICVDKYVLREDALRNEPALFRPKEWPWSYIIHVKILEAYKTVPGFHRNIEGYDLDIV